MSEKLTDAERYAYEERAGIMQHDAGLTREEAEKRAMEEVLKEREEHGRAE